jgi:hypothetical protein
MIRPAFAVVLASLLIAGCGGNEPIKATLGGRVTKANFDAVQNGMTLIQVLQILGRWTASEPNKVIKLNGADVRVKQCQWKRDSAEIDVDFVEDKVVSKSQQGL